MASKTGTIKLMDDGTTKTLVVKDTPDKPFIDPPAWAWDDVKGNAGAEITVTYTESPDTITAVTVG